MTTESEIKEVLKVLELPEAAQWDWIVNHNVGGIAVGEVAHLADLAFRMRDEAKEYPTCGMAFDIIWNYWQAQNKTHISTLSFWLWKAQPIHWILAALIAEILAENKSARS